MANIFNYSIIFVSFALPANHCEGRLTIRKVYHFSWAINLMLKNRVFQDRLFRLVRSIFKMNSDILLTQQFKYIQWIYEKAD